MRQVRARESPREDTDTRNVNDTSEHVVAPLSPSLFPSPPPKPPLRNFTHFTIHSRAPKMHFRYLRTLLYSRRSRTNERTDGRTDGDFSLSFGRASAVPRERNGTVRYGTVQGDRGTGVLAFQIAKGKIKAGPGDARVSRDAPGKLPAVSDPELPSRIRPQFTTVWQPPSRRRCAGV